MKTYIRISRVCLVAFLASLLVAGVGTAQDAFPGLQGNSGPAGPTGPTGPASPPSGAAGGDLSSTYPNPTVVDVTHVTTGVLNAQNGGTGHNTLTAHGVLVGEGTSATASVAAVASGSVLASAGTTTDPQYFDFSQLVDQLGTPTVGSVLYRSSSGWVFLAPGTSGHVLQTNGVGAAPTWVAQTGGGGSGNGTGWVVPSVSGWGWQHQGGSSIATTVLNGRTYVQLTSPNETITNVRSYETTIPATPYAVEVAFLNPSTISGGNTSGLIGILLHNQSNDKMVLNMFGTGTVGGVTQGSCAAYYFSTFQAAAFTLIGSTGADWSTVPGAQVWLRIEDDGTNLNFKASGDGITWVQYATTTRAGITVTPDHLGIFVDNNDGSHPVVFNVLHLNSGTGI